MFWTWDDSRWRVRARTKPARQGRAGYKNGMAREGGAAAAATPAAAATREEGRGRGVRVSYSTQTNPLWRGVYQNER